ncbi:MAG: hypothetical protein D6694_10665 [Gammaproteobacteria bacterium]|nr:MAG: hypothetical protein D6694_10665 [Gammaproteobacteria bacterium]
MLETFSDLASQGIVRDHPPYNLPANVWTDGQNVRFRNGAVEAFSGHVPVFGTPPEAPIWAMSVPSGTTHRWLWASQTKLYKYDGLHSDVSGLSSPYSTTLDDLWNGGILGGIPVIANGVDVPQAWTDFGSPLVDLPNFPANTIPKLIRPFKGHLIAFNLNISSIRYPHRVLWSHTADPGTLPTSWDVADPTVDAGEVDLSDVLGGQIVEAQPLDELMIVYKETSTWTMQRINSPFIFSFDQLYTTIGALTTHCVEPLRDAHVVATQDDLIIHDGASVQSLIANHSRRWLQANIDATYYNRSFIRQDAKTGEVWFCFPQNGSQFPDTALVWNRIENTYGVRDLPSATYAAIGPAGSKITERDLILCAAKFYQADQGTAFDSVPVTASVERLAFPVTGELDTVKLIKRIYPRISTSSSVTIEIGTQMKLTDTVSWVPKTFNPATDAYVDFSAVGRIISIRISGQADWKLYGFEVEFDVLSML